jgi:hypothetical protein
MSPLNRARLDQAIGLLQSILQGPEEIPLAQRQLLSRACGNLNLASENEHAEQRRAADAAKVVPLPRRQA